MNITIDKTALTELKNELVKSEKNAIKIFVSAVRCGGPSLSLAFYNKKDGDNTVKADGIDFYLDNGVEEFGDGIEISKREGFGGGYSINFSDIKPTSCPI